MVHSSTSKRLNGYYLVSATTLTLAASWAQSGKEIRLPACHRPKISWGPRKSTGMATAASPACSILTWDLVVWPELGNRKSTWESETWRFFLNVGFGMWWLMFAKGKRRILCFMRWHGGMWNCEHQARFWQFYIPVSYWHIRRFNICSDKNVIVTKPKLLGDCFSLLGVNMITLPCLRSQSIRLS